MRRSMKLAAVAALALLVPGVGFAATVPFTEDFDTGVSGWEDATNNPLSFGASGGPDGGSYASAAFNYFGFSNPFGGGPVIFRGSASDNASGGAFMGDWLSDGVTVVSAWVRHDAPENLSFFLRVASSFNFPGAVLNSSQLVAPNTWTQVFWVIDPDSPLCIGESVTCGQALTNVGNIQFGTDAPSSLVGTDLAYTLDIDKVAIVPEPVSMLLLGGSLVGLAFLRRRAA